MDDKTIDSLQERDQLDSSFVINNEQKHDVPCKGSVIAMPSRLNSIDLEEKMEEKWFVVEVKSGDEDDLEEEMVCRICHLNNEQDSKASLWVKNELIHLGCSCNGELSVAHLYCAQSWFKLKGNRICEICGQMVNNITGVRNHTFMEEWVENRASNNSSNSSETTQEGCWSGQPLCNFLMACLVIAFVVPWFFHINMFS